MASQPGLEYGGTVRDRTVALVAVAVTIVAAVLIFTQLDQRLLWVDEAETALLGRSILVHGVPTAWDGTNVVSQEVGKEFGPDYVWRWTPWLAKYLVAGSFALFGESTFTARMPFALLGLLAVVSMYPLGLTVFRDRWVGVGAMAFLAFSVPFLLHVRQCRYYAPVILAAIWVLYFFVRLRRGDTRSVVGLVAAMTMLFHGNVLTFLATGLALIPCALTLKFDRAAWQRAVIAAAGTAVLTMPWIVYFDIVGKSSEELYSYSENFRTYLDLTSRYTFPWAALVIFVGLALTMGRRSRARTSADHATQSPPSSGRAADWRGSFQTLLVFMVVYVLVVSAAPWSFYRWSVNLLPVAAVLLAFMCRSVFRWNHLVGFALTAVLMFTPVLHDVSAWPVLYARYNLHLEGRTFAIYDRLFPLGNHLYEVTHPYEGPMEHLVDQLRAQARSGDRIFISYGDLILQFYTDHEIRGGQSGRELLGWPEPEWVIIRSFFRFRDRPAHAADAARTLDWLNNHVPPDHYELEPSTATDVPWDNIAEPQLRWYRVPVDGDPIQIYRRRT